MLYTVTECKDPSPVNEIALQRTQGSTESAVEGSCWHGWAPNINIGNLKRKPRTPRCIKITTVRISMQFTGYLCFSRITIYWRTTTSEWLEQLKLFYAFFDTTLSYNKELSGQHKKATPSSHHLLLPQSSSWKIVNFLNIVQSLTKVSHFTV